MKILRQSGFSPIFVLAISSVIVVLAVLANIKYAFIAPDNPIQSQLEASASPSVTPTATPLPTPKATVKPTQSPAATPVLPVVSNTLPASGYQRQTVKIDSGLFNVDIISANLNSTKVVIDTASDTDCKDNCPVMSLGEYASRSGAYAGINGSFFCPASYPSCAGKANSFDTLLMNKSKHYFNSDNNVYSTVPAAIFSTGSARFVGQSLEWGRDTNVDAVIANYPLYIAGGNVFFGGNGDPKIDDRGSRTFISSKGNMVYIGVVYGATGGEAAKVLNELGMDSALGLDQGGSTALWLGGRYLTGPGRNIPNAVLFVNR